MIITNSKAKKKGAHFEHLNYHLLSILIVVYHDLFSDAEVGEDVIENLGGGDDATSDVGKGIETLTEVFAQKVVGDVHLKTIKNPGDALLGLEERGIVTG